MDCIVNSLNDDCFWEILSRVERGGRAIATQACTLWKTRVIAHEKHDVSSPLREIAFSLSLPLPLEFNEMLSLKGLLEIDSYARKEEMRIVAILKTYPDSFLNGIRLPKVPSHVVDRIFTLIVLVRDSEKAVVEKKQFDLTFCLKKLCKLLYLEEASDLLPLITSATTKDRCLTKLISGCIRIREKEKAIELSQQFSKEPLQQETLQKIERLLPVDSQL